MENAQKRKFGESVYEFRIDSVPKNCTEHHRFEYLQFCNFAIFECLSIFRGILCSKNLVTFWIESVPRN